MSLFRSYLLSYFFPLLMATGILHFSKCDSRESITPAYAFESKQKGMHVFGRIDSSNIKPLIQNNFNWITIVPFSSQEDYNSPSLNIRPPSKRRASRRDSAWIAQIELVQSQGFKVFLKPHVWIHDPSNGKWRSDIYPDNDANWELWKDSYREFIFRYAKIAETTKAEMFCIGTEFTKLTSEKSEFWENLINDVRKIYSGKITYAANWYDEYEKITFWEQLDYIGVQAYFPLAKKDHPSTEEISQGWGKYISKLDAISQEHQRKIIFTEMGYKSTACSAQKPWEWISYEEEDQRTLSDETQVNCYQAFFDTIWKREWMAGVHLWQWNTRFKKGIGKTDLDFTPQEKPAQETIANGFKINS